MDRTEAVRREIVEVTGPVIHWSAVLGGSFVALGTWLFVLALGAAIGSQLAKGGIEAWTAVYTLVAPIIGLFVGGVLAARSRHLSSRFDAVLHGVVIWGFTITISALLMGLFGTMFSSMTRGAAMSPVFSWAIAGSMLGSLIAALLGTATVSQRGVVHREVPHEVNP